MFTINGQYNHEIQPKPILVNSISPTFANSPIPGSSSKIIDSLNSQLQYDEQQQQQQPTTNNNMDDYEIKQPIGYGSSAIVYSAIYLPQNKRVAIKVIDLDMFERNQIDELRRETSLMALSKHPHVLRVYGSFVYGSKLHIVTPYMAVGSCLDIMKLNFPNGGIDEISIATILKQALEGLSYLHKNGHIHRDVKAGNLLMDEDGTVLLADFGVSSSLMESGERKGVRKTFVGTPCWMAPEVMEQADYDYKADIWSFGITAMELATGHAPFAKHPPLKVLMMTLNNDPPSLSSDDNYYSKIFKEMIDSCLVKDPQKRPSSDKLLQHPFFKQAKKPEWLYKNLIVDIPLIENRPTRKVPSPAVTAINQQQQDAGLWDFNDDKKQAPSQIPGLHAPKRHISFGHVTVRKPSGNGHHHHSLSESSSPINTISNELLSSRSPSSSPTTRKSRALSDDFITESFKSANNTNDSTTKKSSRFNSNNNNNYGRTRHGSLHEKSSTTAVSFSNNDKGKLLYRTISHDDNMSRKSSRLSPSPSSPPPPAPPQQQYLNYVPLSRSNSNVSNYNPLTRENSREDQYSTVSSESSKIGRFELTSDLRHSVVDSNFITQHQQEVSSSGSIYNQLDELLNQNELQRQLLNDLYHMFGTASSSSSSIEVLKQQQLIESLEQQLQVHQRENHLLQRENDTMRRQIDQLKNHSSAL